jgi:AcrR family transcriptional regulator
MLRELEKMTAQIDMMDKKTAILEAALNLIAVHGFHGAPTSKIAREAGAGVGSIYRYFQSKEGLIHELFTYVSERTRNEILREFDYHATIREQFIRLSTNTFQFLIDHPTISAFIEQYFNSPYGISHKRDMILDENHNNKNNHPLHALLETAKANKIVKDMPFHLLSALSFGPIIFLVRDIHAGLIDIDSDTMKGITEACWDAIKR